MADERGAFSSVPAAWLRLTRKPRPLGFSVVAQCEFNCLL